ncbi:hypothetical protein Droror1_Dr00020457, partial [Drosera rotundifolia]
ADVKKAKMVACETWDEFNSESEEEQEEEGGEESNAKDCLMAIRDEEQDLNDE